MRGGGCADTAYLAAACVLAVLAVLAAAATADEVNPGSVSPYDDPDYPFGTYDLPAAALRMGEMRTPHFNQRILRHLLLGEPLYPTPRKREMRIFKKYNKARVLMGKRAEHDGDFDFFGQISKKEADNH